MDIDRFGISLPFDLANITSAMKLALLACQKAEVLPEVISHLQSAIHDAEKLETEARDYFRQKREETVKRSLSSMKSRIKRLSKPPRRR